jgi:hypothetical protein
MTVSNYESNRRKYEIAAKLRLFVKKEIEECYGVVEITAQEYLGGASFIVQKELKRSYSKKLRSRNVVSR